MPKMLTVVILLAASLAKVALADDAWPPKRFVVAERTTSPDGKYGIVVPSEDSASDNEENNKNQLADLVRHRLLGTIPGVNYFERQNHRDLEAKWAADSSWCAAVYGGRFGFGECVLLQPRGDSFTATAIGQDIHHAVDAVIQKQAHNRDAAGDVGLHLRLRASRILQVRAFASTNPKQLPEQKTYYAFCSGTYDLTNKRWTKLSARQPPDDLVNLEAAFDWLEGDLVHVVPDLDEERPLGFEGTAVNSEEGRVEVLDRLLKESYAAVRVMVPPARFAKVKEEQRAWLLRREQQQSPKEKNKMTDQRIHELRDVLWED